MEWNGARLKFPALGDAAQAGVSAEPAVPATPTSAFSGYTFGDLCRLGFALTWPVAVVGLLVAGVLLAILLRK
jgi:hypothetical protein